MSISTFDLQQMLARLNQNKIRQPEAAADLSITITTTDIREKKLHDRILAECTARGWLVIHSRMDMPSSVGIGVPDFAIFAHGGRVLLVEAKSATGKLRPEQRAWLAWAQKLNHRATVCRSFEEFLKFVEGE